MQTSSSFLKCTPGKINVNANKKHLKINAMKYFFVPLLNSFNTLVGAYVAERCLHVAISTEMNIAIFYSLLDRIPLVRRYIMNPLSFSSEKKTQYLLKRWKIVKRAKSLSIFMLIEKCFEFVSIAIDPRHLESILNT